MNELEAAISRQQFKAVQNNSFSEKFHKIHKKIPALASKSGTEKGAKRTCFAVNFGQYLKTRLRHCLFQKQPPEVFYEKRCS